MFLTATVIAILLALVYVTSGVHKILETKIAAQMGKHLRISRSFFHVRAGDKAAQIAPPIVLCLFAIAEAVLRAVAS